MVEKAAAMPGMVNRAMRMMAGTLASRILGLLREILTASFFGATRQLDAYYVAYTLANLSRQLLAEGALSASFVPTFSRVYGTRGSEAAGRLARQVLSILLAACALVVAVGILCSPLLVKVIAPGFDDSLHGAAVAFTRALFPFLMIVSVGALAMGVLNSVGSFFVPAVAPAASNLAFIAILIAAGRASIWTMVAAVLAGGICNMALQWTMAWRMGYPLLPSKPDLGDPELRRTLALFLPYAAGLSLNQINPVVSRMLGSFLGDGVISALNYADRIIQLPLGLFVIAISQAVLPMLSRLGADSEDDSRTFTRDALRFNLFVVLPSAFALVLLASPIVHMLLFRGAFDKWAWTATSGALACYAAGLPGMACNSVIMRVLYARRLPNAAVSVTAFTVCVNLLAGSLLMTRFSYMGLAAGTSCAFTGASFFGAWRLKRNIGMPIELFDWPWLFRLLFPCGLMCGALIFASLAFPYPAESVFAVRALWLTVIMLLGCGLYAAVTIVLKCPEWAWIRSAFALRTKIKEA
ncbi:MAG: murein biosynthesis integral membrane protein MurJ [Synergistaceae bacterium]|nr:murein biosynthesis integral membrane protein MurJ [Synergistaceae bacterium]